jgi:hypothetical protein
MFTPDVEGARSAARVAAISTMVVEQGQERLRALQASGAALDQRVTQVAALQLAAAAIAGTLLTGDGAIHPAKVLGAFACLAFVAGALIAFGGMKAGHQQLPGMLPSWWAAAADDPNFDGVHGREWLAAETEKNIAFNCRIDEKRAGWLDASLIVGLGGGLLIVASAFVRLA